jgi:23S rRNA pseudouridine1911/1915/1917 synthase
MSEPVVLYEDNHLLVINKPAAMASQGAAPGAASAVDWAKDYLKRKYAKPGNVFVGVVSRLDRDVSGVLLLARTSKAAARLSEQFRERRVTKTYWAVVEGTPPERLRCVDRVLADERAGRMAIVAPDEDEGQDRVGQEAALSFRRLRSAGGLSLVEVDLETGRKHQIRLQLASRGWPVVGDKKYGGRRTFPAGIALHARRIEFEHPVRRESIGVEAPGPAAWRKLGIELPG